MTTTTTVSNPSSPAQPAAAPQPTAPAPAPTATTPITGTANSSNHGTKIDLQTSYQALIAGLLAFYQSTDSFSLKGGTYTRDEVIDEFRQFIALAEATKASNQSWRISVQAEREGETFVRPLRQGLRGIVSAKYGKSGTELLQFGFLPTKPGKKTVASKAEALVKGKATRVARGTKGTQQKKAIKGDVTGVVLTPVTGAPPAPPVSTGPSTPAPSAGTPATGTPHTP